MSQTVVRPARTAAALDAEARRQGYQPGFPPALSWQGRHADLAAYRRVQCPACASRMVAVPFHRPDAPGGYKIVLACRVCGAGELA